MNTSKLALVAATLALGLGANFASATQLNIDTLVYKFEPSSSKLQTVGKGPVQFEIDTLIAKAAPASTKTRAEVRAEIAMSPKSKTFTF